MTKCSAGRSVWRTRRLSLGIGLASLFLVWGKGTAQMRVARPAGPPLTVRLSVHPREMLLGTRTKRAGEFPLDSLKDYFVYVPSQCVGTRRCPLVIYMHGSNVPARKVVSAQRGFADTYGMMLLAPQARNPNDWKCGDGTREDSLGPAADMPNLNAAIRQVLRKFAVDPDRIALAGASDGGGCALVLGRSNLDVFSRIAAISPRTHAPTTGPRNTTTQFYLSGGVTGFMELGMFALAYLVAEELVQEGHPVKQVVGFRGHEQRPEEWELMWRWLHESWATSTPAAPATPRRGAADSVPVLTADVLARMTAFWSRFMKEPDSIRTVARMKHLKEVFVPVGDKQMSVAMVDMGALAATYPSVAAAFEQAGLTPQQHQAYRTALLSAYASRQLQNYGVQFSIAATSALGKNLEFLGQDDQGTLAALAATGMWITP